ncbi:MAG TPA: septal ring lytic transglycosylase RlpA family protein [Candidatus Micrarchaeaceae archaeon]|nr:septal ring lytic transglycosylase RlpA family protein [Candidatus Micrarchaeaceae archaeon]
MKRQARLPPLCPQGAPSCTQNFRKIRSGLAFALAMAAAIFAAGCARHPATVRPPASTPVPQPAQPPPGAPSQPGVSPPSGAPPAIERQPAVPGEYVEEGVASWYGVPFEGHRTSNGEIYNMHEFTAAHRTLPFNTVVRVTNLRNGKQTEVRINDRGPFVANRIIDLSLSAAQAIDMVGTGTAQVRLEVMSVANGASPASLTNGSFGVQVGAFLKQENAERLKEQLQPAYGVVTIAPYDSPNGTFYRVRVGRLPTEEAAQQLAARLQANEQMTTFVVRLDDQN